MRNGKQFSMIAPSAGFTSRVMTRIAEHERAQARRRALIGSALLVIVAVATLALVAWWLLTVASVLVTTPSVIASLLNAFATLMFWVSKFVGMVWTFASVFIANVGAVQVLMLVLGAFLLTLVWVRVVTQPFQPSPRLLNLGGLRK